MRYLCHTSATVRGLLAWPLFFASLVAAQTSFNWTAIAPTADLRYHPCFGSFRCARLQVPLAWLDADTNNKTIAIAVISLPATVPTDDPTFGGTIIMNPGGPGGSGIEFVVSEGQLAQRMTEGKKHYEILSFDPRGVAYSRPVADCFRNHSLGRDTFLLEQKGVGAIDASQSGLKRTLAMNDAYGSLCETRNAESEILAHMSTAAVARDIIEIADRVEEHRKNELTAVRRRASEQFCDVDGEASEQGDRVLYWGFSYGTVLGVTLASMFPGRMGRVILDGNVEVRDYMAGTLLNSLRDTEKIVTYFFDTCFEGAENCALWKPEDRSGEDIRTRLEDFFEQADAIPFAFFSNDGKGSELHAITGYELRSTFKSALYNPLPTGFEELAISLAEAYAGNFSRVGYSIVQPNLQEDCFLSDNTSPWTTDASLGIFCGDSDYANPDGQHRNHRYQNLSYWETFVNLNTQMSPVLGPWWLTIVPSCVGWRAQAQWRFTGPFTTPPANASLQDGVPAAPILFTSSRLDPVTPLYNAYFMSNDHPGSAVLVLDTVGHQAMGNGWSECFNAHLRAYLDDGILPENGTMCSDTNCKPFFEDGKCQPPPE